MTWSPDPSLLEPCPTCGKVDCKCEPPIITVEHGDVWTCEACGRGIAEGTRVYLFVDEDTTSVVAHLQCPTRASA